MIYETNYKKMEKLGIFSLSELGEHTKIQNGPWMDLSVEVIEKNGEEYTDFSLCHYGKQCGDLMRDPEMIVRVYHSLGACEALYYRNDYVGREQFVYPAPGKVIPRLKKELNSFLRTWLMNLKRQGFVVAPLMQEA